MKEKVYCFFISCNRHNDEVVILRQAKSLREAGWKVVYVVNDDEPDEVVDGLLITGTGVKSNKNSLIQKISSSYKLYKKLISVDADIYQTAAVDQMFLCRLLKRRGKKIIFNLREEHPYTVFSVYGGTYAGIKSQPLKKRMRFHFLWSWMKHNLKYYDYCFATGDDEGDILRCMGVKNYSIQGNFPYVNWDYTLTLKDYLKRDSCIIYYGTIYGISCQEYMMEALEHVDNVKYLLAGSFRKYTSYLERLKKYPSWNKVEFINGFTLNELPKLLGRSTISNILRDFSKTHYHQGNIGVIKMFESMEAALPLICPDVPVYRAIWEKYKFGILVEPTNSKQIEDAIKYLVEHKEEAYRMGQEGRRAVIEKYSWDVVSKEYVAIIDKLYNS